MCRPSCVVADDSKVYADGVLKQLDKSATVFYKSAPDERRHEITAQAALRLNTEFTVVFTI